MAGTVFGVEDEEEDDDQMAKQRFFKSVGGVFIMFWMFSDCEGSLGRRAAVLIDDAD